MPVARALGPGSDVGEGEGQRTSCPAPASTAVERAFSTAGLSRSNHSLLSLFEVGRPGAHHLVCVLHSDHEVSALLTPRFTSRLAFCQQGINLCQTFQSPLASPRSPGAPHWGLPEWGDMVGHCYWGALHTRPGESGLLGAGRGHSQNEERAGTSLPPRFMLLHAPRWALFVAVWAAGQPPFRSRLQRAAAPPSCRGRHSPLGVLPMQTPGPGLCTLEAR